MSIKKMSQLAILAALCIALRAAFAPFPNIKPITAIFLVSIFYLDFVDSLLVMVLAILGSSFLFGFSIVVFWQILSFALIMLVWRLTIKTLSSYFKDPMLVQAILAGILAFSYGFWISIPTAFQFGVNLYIYWLNGLVFDGLHAISTILFYPFIYHLFRRFYHDEKTIIGS